MIQNLLNTEQAAQRLNCGLSTLAKMRLSGRGPTYVKFGRSVRYCSNVLDDWIASSRRQSTSQ